MSDIDGGKFEWWRWWWKRRRVIVQDVTGRTQAFLFRPEGESTWTIPENLGENVGNKVYYNSTIQRHLMVPRSLQLLCQFR